MQNKRMLSGRGSDAGAGINSTQYRDLKSPDRNAPGFFAEKIIEQKVSKCYTEVLGNQST